MPKKVVQMESEESDLFAHHVSFLSLKRTKKLGITSFFLDLHVFSQPPIFVAQLDWFYLWHDEKSQPQHGC